MAQWTCGVLGVALLAWSAPAAASGEAGIVFGYVTDITGRPLAGAVVEASGPALIGTRMTRTSASGVYRLFALPTGSYRVTFHAAGFAVLLQPDVQVRSGYHARADARLAPSTLRDPAFSTASSEIPDPRAAETTFSAPGVWLRHLPLAGWTDLAGPLLGAAAARVPPPLADVLGVEGEGGTEGAPHRVEPDGRVECTLDGLSSPCRGHIDTVEEVRVRPAAMDASVPSASVRVDIVSRSAADRLSGGVRSRLRAARLTWTNVTPALEQQGFEAGLREGSSVDSSAEVGGRVAGRRAWLWGAVTRSATEKGVEGFYAERCLDRDGSPPADAATRRECLERDEATETSSSAKLQWLWTKSGRLTASWSRISRRQSHRGASPGTRPDATTRLSETGGLHPLRLEQEWVVSSRLVGSTAISVSDAGYRLDLQRPDLAAMQPAYDRFTRVRSRSAASSSVRRPAAHVAATGEIFFARGPGGEHAVRFGLDWKGGLEREADRVAGGATAIFDSRGGSRAAYQARIVRDGEVRHGEWNWAAFVQDSYTRGTVTLTGGLRVDVQDDRALPSAAASSPILPDLLPRLDFAGADSRVVFEDPSPRVGVAWDVGGRGATVIRVGAARTRGVGNQTSSPLQPTGPTRLAFWWHDANRDELVQAAELDLARGPAGTPSANYDPDNPAGVRTLARIDPGLRNTATDQYSFGIEQRITRLVSLRAAYAGRRVHQLRAAYRVNSDGSAVSSSTFHQVEWTPTACREGARCPSVTYYERESRLPAGTLLRNDGRYAWHHALDVVLHKRLSRGWTADLRAGWNRAVAFLPEATRDYTDPTNVSMWDGTEYPTAEARWTLVLSGSMHPPGGFGLSAIFSARGGFPYDRAVSSPVRGALGSATVSVSRYGSERYPGVSQLDLRVDRAFAAGRLTIEPAVDVFNVLNSSAVLARTRIQNSATANDVTRILPPRSVRLDLRIGW